MQGSGKDTKLVAARQLRARQFGLQVVEQKETAAAGSIGNNKGGGKDQVKDKWAGLSGA